MLFSFVISTIIYPIYANWVWGGGWLSQLGTNFGLGHGHVDFAGSSVVHMTGGVAALVGAKMLGPRIGKYGADGKPQPIPGHNIPMVVLGTFILAFGWFGFNAGSTLAGTDTRIADHRRQHHARLGVGRVRRLPLPEAPLRHARRQHALQRHAGRPGRDHRALRVRRPRPSRSSSALVAGVLVVVSAMFVENTLKIDDPVGASSVHGVYGAWGILSLGLFADGRYGDGWNGVAGPVRGLFYGDPSQLAAECIGIVANVVWVGARHLRDASGSLDALVGNRVSPHDELDRPRRARDGHRGLRTEPMPE